MISTRGREQDEKKLPNRIVFCSDATAFIRMCHCTDVREKKMKRLGMVMAVFLLMVSGCKVEYNSPQSARDDIYGVNSVSSYTSDSNGDDQTSGMVLSKSGSGDDVVTNLAFKKGAAIFTLRYDGQSTFTVKLLDSNGEIVATLVDKKGSYKGKRVVQIPKDADTYILSVVAQGTWQITTTKADTGIYK